LNIEFEDFEMRGEKTGDDSQKYQKLMIKICEILQIEKHDDEELDSLLQKTEKWAKNMPYFSSTQKEIIELTTEILEAIRKRDSLEEIKEKIEKLDDLVSFDRYFD
jgi:putative protein kinase ArgK-like GTPase of G3E family